MINFNRKRYVSNERIYQIVKEEIDKLLLSEEYSISDIVMGCSNEIADAICDMYSNDEYVGIENVKIFVRENGNSFSLKETVMKKFSYTPSERIKKDISKLLSVNVNVIEMGDVETYKMNYHRIDVGGEYSTQGETIGVDVVAFDGTIRKGMLYQLLLHEVEHAYQYSIARQNDYKQLLAIANKRYNDVDDTIKATARLLYFFNPREIDANIQSFYDSLYHFNIAKQEELANTELISERDEYIKRYYDFLKGMPNDEVTRKIKPIFNINSEFLFHYLEKQIKYLNSKIIRVYHLYTEKNKEKDVILRSENKNFHIR